MGSFHYYVLGAGAVYAALILVLSAKDSARDRKAKVCDTSHIPGEIERTIAGLRVWNGKQVQVFCVIGDKRVEKTFWRNIEALGYGSHGRLTCTVAMASTVYLKSVKEVANTSPDAFSGKGDFITLEFPRESRWLHLFPRKPHMARFAMAMPDSQKKGFDAACELSLKWMIEQELLNPATTSMFSRGRTIKATRSLTSIAQWLETCCNLFNKQVAAKNMAQAVESSAGNENHADYPYGLINPVTGAPMMPGSNIDVYGNLFGAPGINPTTGLPMAGAGVDVAGTAYGDIGVNPASGMPMASGGIDVGGNAFGHNENI